MEETQCEIPVEKKHFYRFIKIYSNEDKENFFVYSTRSKDVSTSVCKLKKSLSELDGRISDIVKDCSYMQVKSGMYTSLEATFERQFIQEHFQELLNNKINNYVL